MCKNVSTNQWSIWSTESSPLVAGISTWFRTLYHSIPQLRIPLDSIMSFADDTTDR